MSISPDRRTPITTDKGDQTVTSADSRRPMTTNRLVRVGGYVAVRTRYMGAWSVGFEVAAHVDQGCLIRRLSDGSVLPDVFQWTEIRPASRTRDVA
jgi:hypothetical protein